jgi:inhibitor of KinA
MALTQKLLASRPDFVLDFHPAYCSVLISFDSTRAGLEEVEAFIRGLLAQSSEAAVIRRQVEIPVCYESEFAPDLQDVAALNHLSPEEVIAIHSSGSYYVCFLGFMPGFAYLGGLSSRLATPRLSSPRTQVPAGSVAIGGNQTGIYPFNTPGGWRLIGRTPRKLFSPEKEPFSFFGLGDEVRFRIISREEFQNWRPSDF